MRQYARALALFSVMLPGVAGAACPGTFSGAACGGVCSLSGGDVICDLAVSGDSADTDSHYMSVSSTQFRAYGWEGDGTTFCCELTVSIACSGNPKTSRSSGRLTA